MTTPFLLRLYSLALHLYPAAFRQRYAAEMLQTAATDYAASPNHLRFAATLLADTLRSLAREHLRGATTASPGYVSAFALFFAFLLLATSVVHQQILRRAADRTPSFLVQLLSTTQLDAHSEAIRANLVTGILTGPRKEISSPDFLNSTQAFAVLYDASAHATTGNATLHGALPQPPIGIFNEIRAHGNDEVTWQPQPGIRVALSGRFMPNGGYVVAGQSLIPSEARTARFNALLRWMAAFCMLTCAALLLITRRRSRHTQS